MRFAHSGYISTPELQLAAGYRRPPEAMDLPHWTAAEAPAAFQTLLQWFKSEGIDAYAGVSVYLSRRFEVDLDYADKIIARYGGNPGLLQSI
ncbi:MAG TPA: hypothetical protein VIL30_26385 [Ramlibacter sp.]|jgi:hypothetical protein